MKYYKHKTGLFKPCAGGESGYLLAINGDQSFLIYENGTIVNGCMDIVTRAQDMVENGHWVEIPNPLSLTTHA